MTGGRALSMSEDMVVGLLVGMGSASITEPLDLVRTRILGQLGLGNPVGLGAASSQPQRPTTSAPRDFGYRGMWHGLRSVAAHEGVLALWRGLLPRLVLKGAGSSIWYATYMKTRRWLDGKQR
eukprot:TRINITY_DN55157_c0_g1_i1.p2 TRINITY_DN55157_c0_g1~~TRINITY_DN55157_c0_g1_i1.p2  ORF type:complete len:123 (-),score=3.67 TRINITY_DN55157_c0_g1_i1:223-591(-)